MITADELTDLRKSGMSDDEIVSKYKQYDPQSSSDIDGLLKDGYKSSHVLDKLVQYHAQQGNVTPEPQQDKGILANTAGAIQYGLGNLAEGYSRTAARTGTPGAETLHGVADATAPKDYDPASGHLKWNSPSSWKDYGLRALVEAAPGLAVDTTAGEAGAALGALAGPIGATAGGLAGFGGSYLLRNYGPGLDARMENQPKGAEPSLTDKLMVGGTAAAEGVLNRFGLGSALGGVVKGAGAKALAQVPLAITKAGAREAAAGAAGDVINQTGRTAGTQEGLSIDPNEAANVGVLSGMTGAGLRAARGVGDVVNANRMAPMDAEAAARHAERIKQTEIDPRNAEKGLAAIEQAGSRLDTDINTYKNDALAPISGDKAALSQVQGVINDLKDNRVVSPKDLEAVKAQLADTQEGQQLHALLAERQVHNQLRGMGRIQGDSFSGGMSSTPLVDTFVNPIGFLKSGVAKVAAGGGAAAGIYGLPVMSQLAMHGKLLGAVAAGQAGLYGGIRAVDSAMGLRNPTKEFVNRFGGLPQGGGATAPSWISQQEQAKSMGLAAGQSNANLVKAKQISDGLIKDVLKRTVVQGQAEGKAQAQAEALRSKQEEAAWKQRDTLQKEQVKRDSEFDKAYAQVNPSLSVKADPEALWAQHEAAQAKALQTPDPDMEAQAGIQQGYQFLAQQAMKAQQARQAQENAGWKQNDQAKQADLKRQAEMERAYAQANPNLPKQADPEALWAQHEAAQVNTPDPDLEAQAGIQQGYQYLAQQALKAQQARQAQENAGWKQKGQQDIQAEKAASARGVEFTKAQAQVNKPTPEQIKASQEDAMWRSQEGKPQGEDWSDQDALAAIQRELKSRETASKAVLKLAQPPKASQKPQETAKAPKSSNGSQKPKTAAGEAPKTSEAPDVETITIKHGDQVVTRPKEGIRNLPAYTAKTKARMQDRKELADDLIKVTNGKNAADIKTMLTHLNNSARSWQDAYGHIEDFVNELPEKLQGLAMDVVLEHQSKIAGTYGN